MVSEVLCAALHKPGTYVARTVFLPEYLRGCGVGTVFSLGRSRGLTLNARPRELGLNIGLFAVCEERDEVVVGYMPYVLPTLAGVNRFGVFARADGGFAQLRWSLDMFQMRGVALIIQLGEVTLRPRDAAQSNDLDHVRRMLGARQQVMLVCTNDRGRADVLSRLGVQGALIRAVRFNLFHLDPGFTAKLVSGDLFTVLRECDAPTSAVGTAHQKLRLAEEGGDRFGVAVSVTSNHMTESARQLGPKLLIIAGAESSNEIISLADAGPDRPVTRLVTLGTADCEWGDHAIVDVRTGALETVASEVLEALRRSRTLAAGT